jgi:predicted TIM-barrel fold metal-dependent hydrolase
MKFGHWSCRKIGRHRNKIRYQCLIVFNHSILLMMLPVSRRQFCRYAAGAAAATALDQVARPTSAIEATQKFPPGRFVDIHTHLGQVWNTSKALRADDLLSWMDANDVSQSVVLPLVSPESSSYLLTTESILTATKPHRDRLIPFCSIDPRTGYTGGHRGLVDLLRRWVDAGAKGFGEHKAGVNFDDRRNMALYAACSELKLPILFHLDNLRNMDKVGLPGVEKALKEFPQATFIGHGPGWWASISGDMTLNELGGYPDRSVTAGGAIDTLMDKYPNLYGDLSAGSGAGALKRDMVFAREFVLRRADRLMFGSDYLSPGQEVPQFVLLRLLNLPADVQAKVFRGNARRLLFNESV